MNGMVPAHEWRPDIMPEAGQSTRVFQLFHIQLQWENAIFGLFVMPSKTNSDLLVIMSSLLYGLTIGQITVNYLHLVKFRQLR